MASAARVSQPSGNARRKLFNAVHLLEVVLGRFHRSLAFTNANRFGESPVIDRGERQRSVVRPNVLPELDGM